MEGMERESNERRALTALVFLLFLGLLVGCQGHEAPRHAAPLVEDRSREYFGLGSSDHVASQPFVVVKPGETLGMIAQRFQLRAEELGAWNRLAAPYRVVAGQKILVPSYRWYEFQLHDRLATVASRAGVSSEKVIALNGLQPGTPVHPGAMLRLPVRGAESWQIPPESQAKASSNQGSVACRLARTFRSSEKAEQHEGVWLELDGSRKLRALTAGQVMHAGKPMAHLGRVLLVKQTDGRVVLYGHLDDVLVTAGSWVTPGTPLGFAASRGGRALVYFGVRVDGRPRNPVVIFGSIADLCRGLQGD